MNKALNKKYALNEVINVIMIAKEVKQRFMTTGMTIKEFAKATKLQPSTIGRILETDKNVNNKVIAPLAKVLKCNPADIVKFD